MKWAVILFLALPAIADAACSGSSPNLTAANASQVEVALCHTAAVTGDTINVPAGSETWSSLAITKAVTLQASASFATHITVGRPSGLTITKSALGAIRIKGFDFIANTNQAYEPVPDAIDVIGNWLGTQPVIFAGNHFTYDGQALMSIRVAGGVIIAENTFTALQSNDFAIIIEAFGGDSNQSWTTADSIGTNDTDGKKNVYIEGNTFNDGVSGFMDCADNCRVVLRHNMIHNTGFNSHGYDSSPAGTRHFEIYENVFDYTRGGDPCGAMDPTLYNVQWYILLRSGTGVIYNNDMTSPISAALCVGDKLEIAFWIRGAEDGRPKGDGSCAAATYPIDRQIGQNWNGSAYFTDPVYMWGNTGTNHIGGSSIELYVNGEWKFGNPCMFDWRDYFQLGRDWIGAGSGMDYPEVENAGGINFEGEGGSPKPGYTAYTYPHPLVANDPVVDTIGGGGRQRMHR